ncbi:MAG: cation-transporting P-type ATPase, partial [Deltaproteobacteria bacterium]|nr:cation-transporting P-type ATPase [Deltaproteobacteria bacterium]
RSAPVLDSGEVITSAVVDRLSLTLLLSGGALCNDAFLEPDTHKPGGFRAMGDPTEGALVVCAAQLGLWKGELERILPRVAEVPFDSQRKRMTTVHKLPDSKSQVSVALGAAWDWYQTLGFNPGYLAFTKGAVDSLLEISREVWVDEHAELLTEEWRRRIVSANDQLAQDGMRVLGVALRPLQLNPAEEDKDSPEQDLIFIGLVGMIDPPRPEVKQAVGTCKDAGIRPVMITGDHPLTARHISRELGIATDGQILTGPDLARLPIKELENVAEEASIYARVSPEHKLNIVQALQNRGHIVAMTGDGVNDAPALRKADIGVAMGITGTDVSKEAADMILLDDNFATIVAAIEEGRVIYDNIRRFIKFLLSCNSGEIWVMLLAPFLGMPLPLLPLQILWMNLVTDGLPALALGVEPAERNVMRRPPHSPRESIFGRGMGRDIIWIGLLCAVVTLGVGYWYWMLGRPQWQTMVFATLTFSQMALVLAVRSERESLFSIGLLTNKSLLGAVVLSFVLQMAVIYIPFLVGLFKTVPLPVTDLILCLALSSVVFWGVELKKRLIRSRSK